MRPDASARERSGSAIPIFVDYLILGGGSAGCVLAARLSERPDVTVMLVEAGSDVAPGREPAEIASAYPGRAFLDPSHVWPDLLVSMTDGGAGAAPRRYEQARVLGGGSSINALLANRGAPRDYDRWAALGATGWGWEDVLPIFRDLEQDLDFDDEFHGKSGPMPVRRRDRERWSGFARAIADAAEARGHVRVADQNGAWRDGIFPIAASIDIEGRRAGGATRYLTASVRARSNLRILTDARAVRLVLDRQRATGAALDTPGGRRVVSAGETLVACGALHSPALLMRSGVGPAADLVSRGIAPVADLAGVGSNLMEHPALGIAAYLSRGARFRGGNEHHIHAALRFSSVLADGVPGDMHMSFVSRAACHAIGERLGVLFFWVNEPRSRGRVALTGPGAEQPLDVNFRLLSHPDDLARIKDAFRLAASLLLDAPLPGIAGPVFPAQFSEEVRRLSVPGARSSARARAIAAVLDLNPHLRRRLIRRFVTRGLAIGDLLADDDALERYCLQAVGGVWHPSGTCRMGRADDPAAVTDAEGQVHGVAGLRVCDASIMPAIPSANINLPTLMIAEKLARSILARR